MTRNILTYIASTDHRKYTYLKTLLYPDYVCRQTQLVQLLLLT